MIAWMNGNSRLESLQGDEWLRTCSVCRVLRSQMHKHVLADAVLDGKPDTLELQCISLSVLFQEQVDVLLCINASELAFSSSRAQLYS